MDDEFDSMADDLRNQDRYNRQIYWHQLKHSDCRDPDHLGCDHCADEEEES